MKTIKEALKLLKESLDSSYVEQLKSLEGKTLNHKTFGEGKVLSVEVNPEASAEDNDAGIIKVQFENAVKNLAITSKLEFKEEEAQFVIDQLEEKMEDSAFENDEKTEKSRDALTMELCNKHFLDRYDVWYKFLTGKIKTTPKDFNWEINRELYKNAWENLAKQVKVAKGVARSVEDCLGTIEDTYTGDVEQLINWLKDNVTSITIESARDEDEEHFKDFIEGLRDQYGTLIALDYKPEEHKHGGEMRGYSINLKVNSDKSAPAEVFTWEVPKVSMSKGETTEKLGLAFDPKAHQIDSRRVVLDLLCNDEYKRNFKLGKNK